MRNVAKEAAAEKRARGERKVNEVSQVVGEEEEVGGCLELSSKYVKNSIYVLKPTNVSCSGALSAITR